MPTPFQRLVRSFHLPNHWRRGDIAFAIALMAVIMMLIIPMPRWMLDMSLAISITFSILILMTTLFINRALDFSSFPTVLLISTMLRLALNVASTRLILTYGHQGEGAAGEIIRAFGNFVMGGNYVIGIIVFSILVIVNFVVITKGSGRIAEVSARFSLDAMPGKQMAIDADLSAGIINEQEAKNRRKHLEDESNFYGSMDGAAKFVRGDAIAGLLITLINIIGGIIIGVAQQNISFAQALRSYTVLTVGDGLVTQIPALLVSTAAGMIVSKSGVEGSAEKAMVEQLSNYPQALGVSSFLLGAMLLLPGIPTTPFLLLSSVTASLSWYLMSKRKQDKSQAKEEEERSAQQATTPPHQEDGVSDALHIDPIRIEIGYNLITLLKEGDKSNLTNHIKILRKQLAHELGFVLPAVRIQDNLNISGNDYVFKLKESPCASGQLRPNMLLIMDPAGRDFTLQGERTNEPTFGLPAMWIDPALKDQADMLNYTVVDPATVLITHLTEVIKDNVGDLLSYSDVKLLLDELPQAHQRLVSDLTTNNHITISGIQKILHNLLAERISIRDLTTIIESIAEVAHTTKNYSLISEYVRSRLGRQLCAAYADEQGILPIISMSAQWEQKLQEALTGPDYDKKLAIAPSDLQQFASRIREVFEKQISSGRNPVLLTSPTVRTHVRSIVERIHSAIPVMSQNEIYHKARIQTLDYI